MADKNYSLRLSEQQRGWLQSTARRGDGRGPGYSDLVRQAIDLARKRQELAARLEKLLCASQ